MADAEDVCVLVPTLNEAATVGDVVESFRDEGFPRVLVVDGGSTDGTPDVAREHGAEVRYQTGRGKGQAVREALESIEEPFVLLVDGDGTYRPSDASALVAPLFEGDAEHVIGDRFADMAPGSMTRLNRMGNRLINAVFRTIHRRDLADVLSGYRAFTASSVDRMHLTADGFGIEAEMAVECVRNRIPTAVVGVAYRPRPDGSSTNLRPFRDGGLIVSTLYRLARTTNPLFYFGSLGVLSALGGLAVAGYVAVEWVVAGTPHQVLAMVAMVGLLFGFQLVTFGVLSDMIVRLYR